MHVSISGFGQVGPYRDRAGHDLNYLAIGGLLGLQAAQAEDVRPPPILLSDLVSGLFAALGICAALAERAQTGRGRFIDLSMADAAASWLGFELARQAWGDPPTSNVGHYPHYGIFEAADGKLVTLGIVYEQHFWTGLCELLELGELRDLGPEDRQVRADEIRERLRAAFKQRPAADWEALLGGSEVPFAVVRSPAEVPLDPQFRERGFFERLPGPPGETFLLPGLPFGLGVRQPLTSAPELDQDGPALRAELDEQPSG